MLMVIFGAGASYDSVASCPPPPSGPGLGHRQGTYWCRPPLADELFLPVNQFLDRLQLFPRVGLILPRLQSVSEPVEHTLEQLQSEAANDPERSRQLLAVRFYLKELINACENEWLRVHFQMTNYYGLLDHLRKYPQICLVTFNYDTMLEKALSAIDLNLLGLESYTSGDQFKVFKLHGSIDWTGEMTLNSGEGHFRNRVHTAEELIRIAADLRPTGTVYKQGASPQLGIPALAIPVVTKSEYVCPQSHVDALMELIPRVDQILIIGWRATEMHFLKELASGLRKSVFVRVVCGGKDAAEESISRLRQA
jgi:hypothetical protein